MDGRDDLEWRAIIMNAGRPPFAGAAGCVRALARRRSIFFAQTQRRPRVAPNAPRVPANNSNSSIKRAPRAQPRLMIIFLFTCAPPPPPLQPSSWRKIKVAPLIVGARDGVAQEAGPLRAELAACNTHSGRAACGPLAVDVITCPINLRRLILHGKVRGVALLWRSRSGRGENNAHH